MIGKTISQTISLKPSPFNGAGQKDPTCHSRTFLSGVQSSDLTRFLDSRLKHSGMTVPFLLFSQSHVTYVTGRG